MITLHVYSWITWSWSSHDFLVNPSTRHQFRLFLT